MSPEIQLTEAAIKRVHHLIQQENNDNLKFRVYITGGGCSGFQYGFAFEELTQEDDIIIEQVLSEESEAQPLATTIKVIVDPLSMTYLQGAMVHFSEGLYGSHFSVKNPNAQTTCGCGSSFSI